MGNKDAGRAIASLDNVDYMTVMGADIDNMINTGIDFTNYAVFKYYKMLREWAVNRIRWVSNSLPEQELRLIEWFIFHYGKCAMVRPKITRKGVRFKSSKLKIYQCNYLDINHRTGRPQRISLVNENTTHLQYGKDESMRSLIVDSNYDYDEFAIFTDEFYNSASPTPFCNVAWEFACKLYELDLAFKANSHRNRMPFVFNNASMQLTTEKGFNYVTNKGVTIAELMRSAQGRNEQFVEVPQAMVGSNGFMHEPQYVNNDMPTHIESQKKLYQAYLELLGLYTNKEKSGVYTIKELQENGDESGDYITKCMTSTRRLCAEDACSKFKIDLLMEVI